MLRLKEKFFSSTYVKVSDVMILHKKREKKVERHFVALTKIIAIIISERRTRAARPRRKKNPRRNERRLGKLYLSVRRTPGARYSGVSNPVSAFAYLADDGRQELDSLSSDVQVRISSTRYGCLRPAFPLSHSSTSARSFFPTLALPVYTLCMHYGRSHGHERWNAPASHTRARTRAFAGTC